jgi:hypothetical protein
MNCSFDLLILLDLSYFFPPKVFFLQLSFSTLPLHLFSFVLQSFSSLLSLLVSSCFLDPISTSNPHSLDSIFLFVDFGFC